jgi:hypothetical protein
MQPLRVKTLNFVNVALASKVLPTYLLHTTQFVYLSKRPTVDIDV